MINVLLSKYVKIFDDIDEENYLLYNSVNRSIIFIPKNWYKNGKLKEEEIDKKFINELKEMDFFMTQEEAISYLEENVHEYNKLFISIETTLACNLRCPYCYQIGATHSKGMIDLKNIDLLIEYMEEVYKQQPFKQLNFKILGGEPTINPESMDYIIKKASKFCKEKNIIFFLLIDTNLTDISYLLNLNDYDKLLLNVPLTHKEIHDKYRVDAQGKGSYDTIIDNLNKMYKEKSDTEILLRYNKDEKNINLFK